MVIVNTVVLVRGVLGLGDSDLAITLAAFGGGSMIAALVLPRLLDRIGDRAVMLPAAAAMTLLLFSFAIAMRNVAGQMLWPALVVDVGVGRRSLFGRAGADRSACCAARRMPRIAPRYSPRSLRCRMRAGW